MGNAKNGLRIKETGVWMNAIQSKIIAMAFSMAAEIERDLISSRTKEALRARKASGLPLGRPRAQEKASSISSGQRLKRCSQTDPHRVSSQNATTPRPETYAIGSKRTELRSHNRQKSYVAFGTFVGMDPLMVWVIQLLYQSFWIRLTGT